MRNDDLQTPSDWDLFKIVMREIFTNPIIIVIMLLVFAIGIGVGVLIP